MVPVFRMSVMFIWCELYPADLAQAKCVLVLTFVFLRLDFEALCYRSCSLAVGDPSETYCQGGGRGRGEQYRLGRSRSREALGPSTRRVSCTAVQYQPACVWGAASWVSALCLASLCADPITYFCVYLVIKYRLDAPGIGKRSREDIDVWLCTRPQLNVSTRFWSNYIRAWNWPKYINF
jgi:hypothetical protein